MYDPFSSREESPEDLASDNRARGLLKYLNTRKDDVSDHTKTVMAFVTQKAAADNRIRALELELDRYRQTEMMKADPRAEYTAPRVMPIPADARSVEVKF